MGKMKIDERSAAMSSGAKSIRVRQIQITLLMLYVYIYYMFIDLAYRSSAFNVYIYDMGNKFSRSN